MCGQPLFSAWSALLQDAWVGISFRISQRMRQRQRRQRLLEHGTAVDIRRWIVNQPVTKTSPTSRNLRIVKSD